MSLLCSRKEETMKRQGELLVAFIAFFAEELINQMQSTLRKA